MRTPTFMEAGVVAKLPIKVSEFLETRLVNLEWKCILLINDGIFTLTS